MKASVTILICAVLAMLAGCTGGENRNAPHAQKKMEVITVHLQPYNGYPADKVKRLQRDMQNCLDTLIPELKFHVWCA